MRHEAKNATIHIMNDDELRSNPEESVTPEDAVSPQGESPEPTESAVDQTVGDDWEADAEEDSIDADDGDDEGWQPAEPRIPAAVVPDVDVDWQPTPSRDLVTETPAPATSDDWMSGDDVDAALAAVASLSMITDREADDLARSEGVETVQPVTRAAVGAGIPMPTPITLKRGQLASIIPALLLIAGGAYWTFVSTTGGQLDPLLILGGGVGIVLIALLFGWISSGRWSRGLLFLTLLILFTIGGVVVTLRTPGLDLPTAFPLLLAAPGLAFIFSAFLARPASSRLLIPGMLLIAAAAVGIVYNAGLLALDLAPILPVAAAAVGIGILLLWLLGIFARRRA